MSEFIHRPFVPTDSTFSPGLLRAARVWGLVDALLDRFEEDLSNGYLSDLPDIAEAVSDLSEAASTMAL